MAHRVVLLIAVATLAMARAAFAADPSGGAIPAVAPAAPVATAPTDATADQIDAWLAGDGQAPSAPVPPAANLQPAAQGARTIHGEASVGFGGNGYREAEVAAVIPVGQSSTLGVAVGDESFRGRDHRNLALSLALGEGATSEPCGLRHTGVPLASDAARLARCGDAPSPAGP